MLNASSSHFDQLLVTERSPGHQLTLVLWVRCRGTLNNIDLRSKKTFLRGPFRCSIPGDESDIAAGVRPDCLKKGMDGIEKCVSGANNSRVDLSEMSGNRRREIVLGDILRHIDVFQRQVPLSHPGLLFFLHRVLKFGDEVSIRLVEQGLCHVVLKVQTLTTGQVLAIFVLLNEGLLHLVGVLQHELLDNCASTGASVADAMKSPEEFVPMEGVAASFFGHRCRAV